LDFQAGRLYALRIVAQPNYRALGRTLLIQSMPKQGLDDRLTADIQLPCFLIKLLKHRQRKIHINPLNRLHHFAFPSEKAGNILSSVGHFSYFIGRPADWGIQVFSAYNSSSSLSRFPKRNQVVELAFFVFPNLKD
jgi:hypothetical protein